MRKVPAEIRAAFQAVLDDVTLPDPLPVDRTINVTYDVAECLAEERTARGIYQLRAGHDERGYHLDSYYELQSPMLFSVHRRLRPDGATEDLPSLRRRRSADPDETRRTGEHNTRVREILNRKGFG